MSRIGLVIIAVVILIAVAPAGEPLVRGGSSHRVVVAAVGAAQVHALAAAAATATAVPASATPTMTATPTATATPLPTATPVPPSAPRVQSPSDADPSKWYANDAVTFTWREPGPEPAIAFGYAIDQQPDGQAPAAVTTSDHTATMRGLDDGTWYFHVRAMGAAGQWGPTAAFQVNLDRLPLTVGVPQFSAFTFNPVFFEQEVWFDVSRPAHVSVQIADATGKAVRRIGVDAKQAGEVDLSWNGKSDAGTLVPAGAYTYVVTAADAHGHHATSQATGLGVTYDRIVVSLSQQSLTAYAGSAPLFSSLVTTGNAALPTPLGTYSILAKDSPFTFHSPWPKDSQFWYKDSPVTYALLFDNGGYFLHDAPWRHDFGPGSNTTLGTPGQDYTGTHGCVNVPYDTMAHLFQWAPYGTVVQVVP